MDDAIVVFWLIVASGVPVAGFVVAIAALARLRAVGIHCRALEERVDLLTLQSVVSESPGSRPLADTGRQAAETTPDRPSPASNASVPMAPIIGPQPASSQTPPVAADERRPPDRLRLFEKSVGQRWITWAGALALFAGVAFFVKYAMDRGWIGPEARVLCGSALGLGLIGAGVRFVHRSMRALGQGLIGGGLAMLYLSIYAAHSLYDLIPEPAAVGLLAGATGIGMVLAVVYRALPVSVLAAVGGFLTPILLWTGFEERDTLFTYLAVLDAGVLGAALLRRWRGLDAMAQGVTWTYFVGWYLDAGSARDPLATTIWLGVFFVLFGVFPHVRHLKTRTSLTSERVAMAFVGAALALGYAADLLYDDQPRVMGAFALGVAAVQLVLAAGTRRLLPDDRRGLFGFAVLALGALTAALPGFFELEELTIALAVEGVAIVWLAHRLDYLPARIAALVPIAISAFRVFGVHWPLHGPGELLTPFWNLPFATALAFVVAALLFAVIERANRSRSGPTDRVLARIAAHAGAFCGMGLVAVELSGWLERIGEVHLSHVLLPLPWIAGALAYLAWTRRDHSLVTLAHGIAALVIGAALVTWCYAFGATQPGADWLVLNWRCAVGLFGVAVLVGFAAAQLRAGGDSRVAGAILLGCSLGATLTLLSADVYQFFVRRGPDAVLAERAAQTALSILWSAFAAALLTAGIGLGRRSLRFAALALLGVTAAKLVCVDLAVLRDAYRIVSFVVLGLVMLGASYFYHRLERRLAARPAHRQGG